MTSKPNKKRDDEPTYIAPNSKSDIGLYAPISPDKGKEAVVLSSLSQLDVSQRRPSESGRKAVDVPTLLPNEKDVSDLYAKPNKGAAKASGEVNQIRLEGIEGFTSYLNGTYRRLQDTILGDRPTFRSETTASPDAGKAAGRYAYMYYHEQNKAWVIGLKLGSSGVAALRNGTEQLPTDESKIAWQASDASSKFNSQRLARAVVVPGGEPLPAEEIGGGGLTRQDSISAVTRDVAESCLHDHSVRGGKAGAFVVRESTSTPDAYVLSILAADGKVFHIRIDKSKTGQYHLAGSSNMHASLAKLIQHYSKSAVQCGEASGTPMKLNHCCAGSELFEKK